MQVGHTSIHILPTIDAAPVLTPDREEVHTEPRTSAQDLTFSTAEIIANHASTQRAVRKLTFSVTLDPNALTSIDACWSDSFRSTRIPGTRNRASAPRSFCFARKIENFTEQSVFVRNDSFLPACSFYFARKIEIFTEQNVFVRNVSFLPACSLTRFLEPTENCECVG